MAAKAFIISPIGPEGSSLRTHADWVRKEVIEKACELLTAEGRDIVAERSDDNFEFAHVTDEVIDRIVNDRVVFVVLGGDRPNCYFELGIAIAAGRPAVILKHKDEKTNFDTNDYRIALEYALPDDLSSPAPSGYIARIASATRKVLDQPRHFPLVHHKYDPLGRNFVEWRVYNEFRNIDLDEYSRFFADATRRICLQGFTLAHFTSNTFRRYRTRTGEEVSFLELLAAKILIDACDVDIVMMHEDNPALPHLHRRGSDSDLQNDLKTTRNEIKDSFDKWTRFKQNVIDAAQSEREDGRKGTLRIIQLSHGVVHYRLSATEKELILSPYINTRGFNSHGPAFRTIAMTSFYREILQEYDDLINQNGFFGRQTA